MMDALHGCHAVNFDACNNRVVSVIINCFKNIYRQKFIGYYKDKLFETICVHNICQGE